jgi:hypothetical protein
MTSGLAPTSDIQQRPETVAMHRRASSHHLLGAGEQRKPGNTSERLWQSYLHRRSFSVAASTENTPSVQTIRNGRQALCAVFVVEKFTGDPPGVPGVTSRSGGIIVGAGQRAAGRGAIADGALALTWRPVARSL